MTTETTELDISQEEISSNGHDATWQTFDDDQAFLNHVLSRKPAEKLVDMPEWDVQVLCRALSTQDRVEVQMAATDEKTKRYDLRKVFHLVVMYGCYNPTTGHRIFKESHKQALMREQDGVAIERLAITILRLSRLLAESAEDIKKN